MICGLLFLHPTRAALLVGLLCAGIDFGGAASYWGNDNRLVQGYTDNQGRHYPRLPGPLIDFYSSQDDDVSNQITRHHALPAAPHTRYSGGNGGGGGGGGWRHRLNHQDKPQSGRRKNVVVPDSPNALSHEVLGGSRRGSTTTWTSGGVYRTSQRGSAIVPYRGAEVNVPVLESSAKTYRGSITTSVVPPPPQKQLAPSPGGSMPVREGQTATATAWRPEDAVRDAPAVAPPSNALPCVRCPGDRAIVANRGRHLVLLEQPELRPCPQGSRLKLPDLHLEWTQGPKPGNLVEEGQHIMVGHVKYRDRLLQICRMKLNVVVRKCPPLLLPKHLEARCTSSNSWGSKCHFSCNHGLHIKGHATTECMDNLSWSRPIPVCEVASGCPHPMSPPHGRLNCKTSNEGSRALVLPENTECQYVCDAGFAVPLSQSHLSVISCHRGEWNSTVDPSCISTGLPRNDHPNAIQRDSRNRPRRRHKDHRLRTRLHRNLHRMHGDPCHPNPCQEGGTCLRGPKSAPAICLCKEHREGEFCEYARCTQNCENGGKCVVFGEKASCFCPTGFSGQYCEKTVSR